jgi:hypothetical protein
MKLVEIKIEHSIWTDISSEIIDEPYEEVKIVLVKLKIYMILILP